MTMTLNRPIFLPAEILTIALNGPLLFMRYKFSDAFGWAYGCSWGKLPTILNCPLFLTCIAHIECSRPNVGGKMLC
jgi:hypothetical protein